MSHQPSLEVFRELGFLPWPPPRREAADGARWTAVRAPLAPARDLPPPPPPTRPLDGAARREGEREGPTA